MVRRKETRKLTQEERQEKRQAILAALTKASVDNPLMEAVELSSREPQDYYTLSHAEMEALINGDMEKLENWVSNLDRNHATKLLRWLLKERW
jgi:hypothetical protein